MMHDTVTFTWRRPLRLLRDALVEQLRRRPDGQRVVALLPHGAFVEYRLVEGRGRIRIGRSTKPETPEALRRWATEVGIFVRDLQLGSWTNVPCTAARGVVVAFLQPAAVPSAAASMFDALPSA